MNQDVCQRLLQLNDQFYQTFAIQFSATRQRLQPGVRRAIEVFPDPARILDIGCGNGELARQLAERGQQGEYIGLDNSPGLLDIARITQPAFRNNDFKIHYDQADLSKPDWDQVLGDRNFDVICAFAVFHHFPGADLRERIIKRLAVRLAYGGMFIHSEWQFLNSQRLRERIQPWESINLQDAQVDIGDYLLDWRGGGNGLRYVHQFTRSELEQLAENTGFNIQSEYSSDGENGQLGLYQVWTRMTGSQDYSAQSLPE